MSWDTSIPVSYTHLDVYKRQGQLRDIAGSRLKLLTDAIRLASEAGDETYPKDVYKRQGVNTEEDANAVIYIYDIKTGNVEKGAEVEGRFYFDMIRVIAVSYTHL